MGYFLFILTCFVIGLLSGSLSALCGVGGGVILVPAFVFILKMEMKVAIATSLMVIVPTALLASVANSKSMLIDWKVAVFTSISACIIAYFASSWMKAMSNDALTRLFAIFLICMGVYKLLALK